MGKISINDKKIQRITNFISMYLGMTEENIVFSCQKCKNCSACIENSHPDIIEIDAASHTGVDNIKNIIDIKNQGQI